MNTAPVLVVEDEAIIRMLMVDARADVALETIKAEPPMPVSNFRRTSSSLR